MPSPRRTPFLIALLVPLAAFAACADSGADDTPAASEDGGSSSADDTTTTSEAAAEVGTGKGTFVVGDRTYTFDAEKCSAEKGDPVGTVLAEGRGTFDSRPFTVTVKSAPTKTSTIETVQVVFAATEAVVGTNYVELPSGAADVKFKVEEDGKAGGAITVLGTGGQPSGDGTLTLECDPS